MSNTKPTKSWLANRKRALDYLIENFPDSIASGKPLKVGVIEDIRALDDETKPALIWFRRALALHTSKVSYLKMLKAGQARVDLIGNQAGEVTAAEEANAIERIKQFKRHSTSKTKAKETKPAVDANPILNRPILTLKKKKPKQ